MTPPALDTLGGTPPAATAPSGEPILRAEHITQHFKVPGGTLEAVSDVSLSLLRGETLGVVGESGCGKSSIGRAILQLPRPTFGSVTFEGKDLTKMPAKEFRAARRRLQVIFQDPVSALNPLRRITDIVAEGLQIAGVPKAERMERVDDTLRFVGLDPETVRTKRPHQLSGGQNQRVAIARALVLNPSVLICDEPVASLDVSVQGQVLNLLETMRRDLGLSMIFISHDLSVVHNISDRIAVMYLGRLVEIGSSNAVTRRPAHPYSAALLQSVPVADPTVRPSDSHLRGEIPSPLSPPSGCRFRTRCPLAEKRCAEEVPLLREVAEGQMVACHFPLVGGPGAEGQTSVGVTLGGQGDKASANGAGARGTEERGHR